MGGGACTGRGAQPRARCASARLRAPTHAAGPLPGRRGGGGGYLSGGPPGPASGGRGRPWRRRAGCRGTRARCRGRILRRGERTARPSQPPPRDALGRARLNGAAASTSPPRGAHGDGAPPRALLRPCGAAREAQHPRLRLAPVGAQCPRAIAEFGGGEKGAEPDAQPGRGAAQSTQPPPSPKKMNLARTEASLRRGGAPSAFVPRSQDGEGDHRRPGSSWRATGGGAGAPCALLTFRGPRDASQQQRRAPQQQERARPGGLHRGGGDRGSRGSSAGLSLSVNTLGFARDPQLQLLLPRPPADACWVLNGEGGTEPRWNLPAQRHSTGAGSAERVAVVQAGGRPCVGLMHPLGKNDPWPLSRQPGSAKSRGGFTHTHTRASGVGGTVPPSLLICLWLSP